MPPSTIKMFGDLNQTTELATSFTITEIPEPDTSGKIAIVINSISVLIIIIITITFVIAKKKCWKKFQQQRGKDEEESKPLGKGISEDEIPLTTFTNKKSKPLIKGISEVREENVAQIRKQTTDLQEQYAIQQREIESMTKTIKRLEKEVKQQKDTTMALQDQIDTLRVTQPNSIKKLENEAVQQRSTNIALQAQIDTLITQINSFRDVLLAAREAVQKHAQRKEEEKYEIAKEDLKKEERNEKEGEEIKVIIHTKEEVQNEKRKKWKEKEKIVKEEVEKEEKKESETEETAKEEVEKEDKKESETEEIAKEEEEVRKGSETEEIAKEEVEKEEKKESETEETAKKEVETEDKKESKTEEIVKVEVEKDEIKESETAEIAKEEVEKEETNESKTEEIAKEEVEKEGKKESETEKIDSLQEKENLLLEFWYWLTKRYKTLKVRRLYIGQENAGTTGLNRRVIVLVTDDFRLIKETKFNYYRNSFPIICKSFRFPSPEGAKITGMEKDIVFDKSLYIKIRKCIQHISSSLFEKHSNLEIISASGFRSLKNGEEIIREPCIVFYCACKGVIPFGESEFPKIVSDIQTDVREGFFYQFPNEGFFKRSTDVLDPLMMGGSISSKDLLKGGTLGGFVTLNNGGVGFITCAHVLFDLSAHCNERAHFDVVQPAYSYNNTNNVCGFHESSFFPTTPFQQCTLDVSLVKLTNRIPERGLFSDLSVEDLLENGFNIGNLPEYSEGTIRDYRQEHFAHLRDPCFKWGAKTGFTKGALRLNGISVRWSNDVIDLGNPSSQCSYVYHSQLECLGTGTSFALPGDSGALVFQLDPMATKEDQHRFHCIGMIVGGTSDFKTIVTPIGPILEALNVKMHTFPQEKMDES